MRGITWSILCQSYISHNVLNKFESTYGKVLFDSQKKKKKKKLTDFHITKKKVAAQVQVQCEAEK